MHKRLFLVGHIGHYIILYAYLQLFKVSLNLIFHHAEVWDVGALFGFDRAGSTHHWTCWWLSAVGFNHRFESFLLLLITLTGQSCSLISLLLELQTITFCCRNCCV